MSTIRSLLRKVNRYTLLTLNPQLDHFRSGRSADLR